MCAWWHPACHNFRQAHQHRNTTTSACTSGSVTLPPYDLPFPKCSSLCQLIALRCSRSPSVAFPASLWVFSLIVVVTKAHSVHRLRSRIRSISLSTSVHVIPRNAIIIHHHARLVPVRVYRCMLLHLGPGAQRACLCLCFSASTPRSLSQPLSVYIYLGQPRCASVSDRQCVGVLARLTVGGGDIPTCGDRPGPPPCWRRRSRGALRSCAPGSAG